MLDFRQEKEALYTQFLRDPKIIDKRVLKAFLAVSREDFIPHKLKIYTYDDRPLPIGHAQTISQPTTVVLMSQWLEVKKGMKVLEVGSGSGFQAAILSHLVGTTGKVFSVEAIKALYETSKKCLKKYKNVQVLHGDGSFGLSKEAPFDRIILTAASPKLPKHLLKQLKKKGILLAPIGDSYSQEMIRVKKGFPPEKLGGFIFVPLTGKYGER